MRFVRGRGKERWLGRNGGRSCGEGASSMGDELRMKRTLVRVGYLIEVQGVSK